MTANIKVKICGIQSLEEAMACIDSGADAVGFLVGITHRAEDSISLERCREIIGALPPFINKVMVTHLTRAEDIICAARHVRVDTLQLHEDVSPDVIEILKRELPYLSMIKAIHVQDMGSIEKALFFEPLVNAILLDSRTEDRIGGTGVVHDWNVSAEIRKRLKKPLILAGGLRPENVAEAVSKVIPYAVDVNSGVEDKAGRKDRQKVKKFIDKARHREC